MADKHTPYSLSDWLTYLSHREIDRLNDLAVRLPANPTVINIGAGGGTSGMTFFMSRPDLYLVTIDLEADDNPYGGLFNEQLMFKNAGITDDTRYMAVQGDSKYVGKVWSNYWDKGPVDLVFIDGGHSYQECMGDITIWGPHLKVGGYMAIHDYKKIGAYLKLHPESVLSEDLIGKVIKPYPGVDGAVDDWCTPEHGYTDLGVTDTLAVFRKVKNDEDN